MKWIFVQVTLITPAGPVKAGARVTLGKPAPAAFPAVLNPKKKVWESAAPHLAVVESGGQFVAAYKNEHLLADGVKLVSSSTGSVG